MALLTVLSSDNIVGDSDSGSWGGITKISNMSSLHPHICFELIKVLSSLPSDFSLRVRVVKSWKVS